MPAALTREPVIILTLIACASLQHPAAHVMHHFPQWSPDGTTILASSTIDGDSEIFLFSLDGSAPRQLTRNAAADDIATWSRDGRRIFFTSDRRGRLEPFVMNADGSEQAPFTGAAEQPSAPDGTQLIESSVQGRVAIVAVSPDGKRRVLTDGQHAEQGSFSPDGRWIVYEQRNAIDEEDIKRSNIVIAKPDGSERRIVSPGTDPSWSTDGRSLLFKIWNESDQQLWIATASRDGGTARRLSPGVHPAWSPDGRRIAFMRDSGSGTDIWVMDADGANPRCITCRS